MCIYMYVCITESLCCMPETLAFITLSIKSKLLNKACKTIYSTVPKLLPQPLDSLFQ